MGHREGQRAARGGSDRTAEGPSTQGQPGRAAKMDGMRPGDARVVTGRLAGSVAFGAPACVNRYSGSSVVSTLACRSWRTRAASGNTCSVSLTGEPLGESVNEQAAPDKRLRPGAVVSGRYELIGLLGTGGMGAVWKAKDCTLDAPCALKFIDESMVANDEVRARFEREAKAAAQIRSPHVVDVFEYGVWQGRPYIAMEYLDGEELAARLERVGMLDASMTYRIVAHVARALMRAHAGGIVHRDLKPENIFLVDADSGENAKVLDFGIAKHSAYSIVDKTTKTGSFLGTPYYMSPEQARGEVIDHRSDLWALAVIAFQCLAGRPPFHGDSLGTLLGQIMYEGIPRIREAAPHLPAAVEIWWTRAIERNREKRFQTAAELSDALGDALGLSRVAVGGTHIRGSAPPPLLLPPDPGLLAITSHVRPRASDIPISRTQPDQHHDALRRRAWEGGHYIGLVGIVVVLASLGLWVGYASGDHRPDQMERLIRPAYARVSARVERLSAQTTTSIPVADFDAEDLFRTQRSRDERDRRSGLGAQGEDESDAFGSGRASSGARGVPEPKGSASVGSKYGI